MKIVLTGGGTGGHFYPLIAVAQELREITKEEKLISPELYFLSDAPYDPRALFELGITFRKVSAGKVRRYFSILNFFDIFRTAWGCIKALYTVFSIYPDVVFAKGGYAAFPTLMAAKILGIPVVLHESDSKPGKVNSWAGKFAKKIALSYPDAAQYFPLDKNKQTKTAWTGNPIRPELAFPAREGAREFLELEAGVPVILILGGSQGSQIINDTIIGCLDSLVKNYQIIHQTGKKNFKEIKNTAEVVIGLSQYKNRYKPFDYLNLLAMRMSAGIADLVITRSGSTIFEVAAWGVPSIVIPIPESVSHDQTKNAFNYARSGGAEVMEETNLTAEVLQSEIKRILDNPEVKRVMGEKAKAFSKTDAAHLIAKAVIDIGLSHEK
jgi:UDP-N-acetylglucosamine--N-acetylmuramyl-(pentapeptide) pyrophosphoryl-undecaprenol N-acetylglucosamine transferase